MSYSARLEVRCGNVRHRLGRAACGVVAGMLFLAGCHGTSQANSPGRTPYSIDTPIHVLVQNDRARGILEHYAPGLTSGPHYLMTSSYSLRQLKPLVHGVITDAELAQMQRELSAIR